MEKIRNFVLRDRHTLLLVVIASYIGLVVIEGLVMDRESRVYTFENPYFDLNLNNMEEFESLWERSR